MRHNRVFGVSITSLLFFAGTALAAEPEAPSAAERGRIALTSTGYLPPAWSGEAYKKAARFWGEAAPDQDEDPEAYAKAFRTRYGLHAAPYENDGLPMGLRSGGAPGQNKRGLQIDCLVCHGGSIGGKSYVGLGNTTLDLHALLADLTRAEGIVPFAWGFRLNTTRGLNSAGQVAALLLSFRNTDLSRRVIPLPLGARLPEMDTPAWWLLKRKLTMYYDGRTDSESARSIMQFFLGDLSLEELKALEPTFKDVLAYLKSIEAPKYPFEVDRAKAERGETIFRARCAKCHGTYGPGGEYPNRVIALKEIGTDPARAQGLSDKLVAHYNATWLGEELPADEEMVGYQAPPLDGLWATAPYLHNGSVPTLVLVLNSKARPKRFWRHTTTEFGQYDKTNVGWKFTPADDEHEAKPRPPHEARFLYDTSKFGLGNGGHTFGDSLSEDERMDLIEYLKTL